MFLRSRGDVMAMKNIDIIRTIAEISFYYFYIYSHIQVTKTAIKICSLRFLLKSYVKELLTFGKTETSRDAVLNMNSFTAVLKECCKNFYSSRSNIGLLHHVR